MRIYPLLAVAFVALAANSPTPTPPKLRLGDAARPVRYAAELAIDPTRESFDGTIDIEVTTHAPQSVLWLNASDLSVKRVEVTQAGKAVKASVVSGGKEFIGIAFDKPLPAGSAKVKLTYTGQLSSKDSSGASRQKEGEDWYVFSHFEPIDARRVFPCFDEPSFKVPWQLTLKVRAQDQAFANTPVTSEKDAGSGYRRVAFAETKPLPSYLLAFGVGPFEIVDGGKSPRSGTPVRIITPKGQAAQARWAAESSREALAHLEAYFGMNYPYEKLDCIAVPLFGGAMENPGLVTFSSQLLLRRPEEETIQSRRAYANVAIHEFAHQWFGDLVTHAWWDEIWLNEAFATWMTPKIVEIWQPSWGAAESRVGSRSGAMGTDSMVTARKIRQPIETNDDVKNAFDGITYGKGAAVITMFERWVGADVFQRGVQQYMKDHAHGTATAPQFLQAISAAAGRDIAPAFSTFLDQPGVPLVTMDVKCEPNKVPVVALEQKRYLPEGSEGAAQAASQTWQIPVCVRWPDGRACTLLSGAKGELPLVGAKSCPAWVQPNEASAGYYRANLDKAWLGKLLKDGGKALTVPERIGAVGDMAALVRAGKLPYAEALALVPKLAQDPNRHVVQATLGLVSGLRDGQLFPDALKPAYARFVRDTYGKRARALGWSPKKGEDEDTRILRNALVTLVADQGEDPALQGEARKLATAWLGDHKAVDPEMVDALLDVAAQRADRAFFDTLLQAARKERDRHTRRRLLGALASFRDPAIVKDALPLVLGADFEIRESMTLLWGATRTPPTRPLAYAFVKANFDAITAKLPRDGGAQLPYAATSQCDDSQAGDIRAFFQDRSAKIGGGPRVLAQALESLRLCATFRRAQGPSVVQFLGKSK